MIGRVCRAHGLRRHPVARNALLSVLPRPASKDGGKENKIKEKEKEKERKEKEKEKKNKMKKKAQHRALPRVPLATDGRHGRQT